MNIVCKINRDVRSILTLNRDREYSILVRMLDLKPTDYLLDVGSGDSYWTERFAKHCKDVIGLEPDSQLMDYAREFHHHRNVSYIKSVAESIPFADGTFDKVVGISTSEHFNDPVQGLCEMARILKPGGKLAISVDSLLPENSPSSFRAWHKRRHFVSHYFRQDELLTKIRKTGLHCDSAHTVHLICSRISAFLRQVFIRHPRFWLPLFPFFYVGVRLADKISNDKHGQIIIVTATR